VGSQWSCSFSWFSFGVCVCIVHWIYQTPKCVDFVYVWCYCCFCCFGFLKLTHCNEHIITSNNVTVNSHDFTLFLDGHRDGHYSWDYLLEGMPQKGQVKVHYIYHYMVKFCLSATHLCSSKWWNKKYNENPYSFIML
jgi:hypothetical protein